MKVQWKRLVQAVVLSASLLTLAGCGSDNIMDTYSFGNQVIRSGQSEVTVALPYEMGKSNESLSPEGYPMDLYGSNTQHIMITVEALQPAQGKPLPTVEAYVKAQEANYGTLNATVKDEKIDLNGEPAVLISGTFPIQNRQISFSQYVFEDHGVLWNIAYRYPTDDQIGAAISKEIANKIYVTQKKEG